MGMLMRRHHGRKARAAAEVGNDAIALTFEGKRQGTPGTPLGEEFLDARTRAALAAARPSPYTAYEDLIDATEAELTRVDGIGPATARKIIAEVAAWRTAQETPQEPQQPQEPGDGDPGDDPGDGDTGAPQEPQEPQEPDGGTQEPTDPLEGQTGDAGQPSTPSDPSPEE